MSQFAFLRAEFSEAHEHAARAESSCLCRSARSLLLRAVRTGGHRQVALPQRSEPEGPGPRRRCRPKSTSRAFSSSLVRALSPRRVSSRAIGNNAVHDARAVPFAQAVTSLRELFHIAYWFARTYGRANKPDAGIVFAAEALPRTSSIPSSNLRQLQEIAKRFAETVAARDDAEKRLLAVEVLRAQLEAELAEARAEYARIRVANSAIRDTHDYNEAQTRDAFIDILLRKAGWPLHHARDREFPVTGMPNAAGEGFVDYVLWGDDGKPLALVEAKRTKREARIGQQQAKLYADCLQSGLWTATDHFLHQRLRALDLG